MERQNFLVQIRRLEDTYGERSYPKERLSLFWRAVEKIDSEVFSEAIDDLISNERSAPMADKILNAVKIVEERHSELRNQRSFTGGTPAEVMQSMAPTAQNREFATACADVARKYSTGQINKKQFEEACEMLDQIAAQNQNKRCKDCNGSGLATQTDADGYNFLNQCHCAAGRLHDYEMFAPGDKQKQNPIKLERLKRSL